MAVILDLSDELIILISSNISKPSHMLQLALANKRIHGIAIQHLYGNVTFNQEDYLPHPDQDEPPPSPNLWLPWGDSNTPSIVRNDYTAPHSNILCLSNMIHSNTIPAGQIITRLAIHIGVNHDCNKFQTLLSLLLPQLSSLKHLDLKSVSEDCLAGQHLWHEQFSLAPLGVALSHASQTLRSLSMHFFLDASHSHDWAIGSLRHFSKLEYLSVQGEVLLGPCGISVSGVPSLDSVLPPGLKHLCLHWCMIEGIQFLSFLLSDFVKDSLRISRKAEEIVVQLDAKATNQHYQSNVEFFEGSLTDMNEEARQGGLDLKLALEWKEDYRWGAVRRSNEAFLEDQLKWIGNCMRKSLEGQGISTDEFDD